MNLGDKIKQLRKSKGISQEELASILKINRNYLSRIETGKSEPTSSILKHLGEIFTLDLNSLLEINNKEQNNDDKVKYILENTKYLNNKDLDYIIRTMSIMKQEYIKLNLDK